VVIPWEMPLELMAFAHFDEEWKMAERERCI
jgi:hypothetical protein